jgi:hypothetical protein
MQADRRTNLNRAERGAGGDGIPDIRHWRVMMGFPMPHQTISPVDSKPRSQQTSLGIT